MYKRLVFMDNIDNLRHLNNVCFEFVRELDSAIL